LASVAVAAASMADSAAASMADSAAASATVGAAERILLAPAAPESLVAACEFCAALSHSSFSPPSGRKNFGA